MTQDEGGSRAYQYELIPGHGKVRWWPVKVPILQGAG
jgi:hypothetical protein